MISREIHEWNRRRHKRCGVGRKERNMLMKRNITRNTYTSCMWIITTITLMFGAITQECTLDRASGELRTFMGWKDDKTSAPKNSQMSIGGRSRMKTVKRGVLVENG